jgi:hypothetical protein
MTMTMAELSTSLIQWVSQPIAAALLLATVTAYTFIAKRSCEQNASKKLLPLPVSFLYSMMPRRSSVQSQEQSFYGVMNALSM